MIPTGRPHSFILGAILLAGVPAPSFRVTDQGLFGIHGFERRVGFIADLLNYHTLERFLAVGIVLTLLGLVIGGFILHDWIFHGFGELAQIT